MYILDLHPVICTMFYYLKKDKKRSNSCLILTYPLSLGSFEELLDFEEQDDQPLYHLLQYVLKKCNLLIIYNQQTLPISVALEKVLNGLLVELSEITHTSFSLCFLSFIILANKGLI